jgi:hypothetical protein
VPRRTARDRPAAWQLKWLFALLIVLYGLLPPETPCCDTIIGWPVPASLGRFLINLTGLQTAGLMWPPNPDGAPCLDGRARRPAAVGISWMA